jgi:signal transduction histidine kinase
MEEDRKTNLELSLKRFSLSNPKNYYFKKAATNFLNEEWDSVLLFSFKELEKKELSSKARDWCNYLRGVSLKKKQLLLAASQSLKKVSSNFEYQDQVLVHLGSIALEDEKYHTAISYFKRIKLSHLPKTDFNKSALFQNLGLCYLHLKDFDKAESYLIQSTKFQEAEHDTLNLVSTYTNLANLYYEQYKDDLAIPYFEKAYLLSLHTRNYELKQNAALNMAVVEENRNRLSKSISYRKEFENWRDSLNNQNKIWKLAEAEKKFAVGQKQEQIHTLQIQNKLKNAERNASLLSIAFLVFILLIVGYSLWRQHKSKRIILAQKHHLNELNLTKDKLFSVVSHDLRSSVSALKGSNEKLSGPLSGKKIEEIERLLKVNSSLTNGVYSLLDNLLNWAMIQTKQLYFHRESIRLSAVVEQVMYNYAPLMAHKNMHSECKIEPDVMVNADLDSLKVVLRNLFDNAIKFSDEQGTIKVYGASVSPVDYELIVEDNGIGMSERTLQTLQRNKIILPNERQHDRAGTGLGLQLCKEILEKNEGKLEIESQEGQGTRIRLFLKK